MMSDAENAAIQVQSVTEANIHDDLRGHVITAARDSVKTGRRTLEVAVKTESNRRMLMSMQVLTSLTDVK